MPAKTTFNAFDFIFLLLVFEVVETETDRGTKKCTGAVKQNDGRQLLKRSSAMPISKLLL
jgi:hypothetical protein